MLFPLCRCVPQHRPSPLKSPRLAVVGEEGATRFPQWLQNFFFFFFFPDKKVTRHPGEGQPARLGSSRGVVTPGNRRNGRALERRETGVGTRGGEKKKMESVAGKDLLLVFPSFLVHLLVKRKSLICFLSTKITRILECLCLLRGSDKH